MSQTQSVDPAVPPHLQGLLRHFADLRDGTHAGQTGRRDKEAAFAATVRLLDPYVVGVLEEFNESLLLGSGTVAATGLVGDQRGGSLAQWTLSWPEQRRAGVDPISIHAHYGAGFHHPHLRGGTVGEWPLNVFSPEDAAAELPTLRAIAASDLHNLVFQADFRIVPATVRGQVGSQR